MKKQYKRTDRVAEFMQRELSQLIQKEIKDPRLPRFVTVSGVTVSADLNYAKVYFTVLSGDIQETLLILNSAASYLRSLLAKSMKMYTVPQLVFIYDESLEYGRQLSHLIDQANAGDAQSTTDDALIDTAIPATASLKNASPTGSEEKNEGSHLEGDDDVV